MNHLRCQVNTSIKHSLKVRIQNLQKQGVTIETMIATGVSILEKKAKKSRSGKASAFDEYNI